MKYVTHNELMEAAYYFLAALDDVVENDHRMFRLRLLNEYTDKQELPISFEDRIWEVEHDIANNIRDISQYREYIWIVKIVSLPGVWQEDGDLGYKIVVSEKEGAIYSRRTWRVGDIVKIRKVEIYDTKKFVMESTDLEPDHELVDTKIYRTKYLWQ